MHGLLTIQQDYVALLYPLLSESTSKSLNFAEKLTVCIFFLCVCHRTVKVDCDGIAMPIKHMAINAIVTSGYLAAWKPLPAIMCDTVLESFLSELDG